MVKFQAAESLEESSADTETRAELQARADRLFDLLGPLPEPRPRLFKYVSCVSLTADQRVLSALLDNPEVRKLVESVNLDDLARPALDKSTDRMGADDAWTAGLTGAGQEIAVLDTGFDLTHTFLGNKVRSEACYSTRSKADGLSPTCPMGVTESTASGSAFLQPGSHAVEERGHGTHVAAIAAGRSPDGKLSGVAKEAGLILVQVFSWKEKGGICPSGRPCLVSSVSDQIRGLERVYELRTQQHRPVAAVNLSLSIPKPSYSDAASCDAKMACLKEAVELLRREGIPTVVAAGNDFLNGSLPAPACISTAISVGASTGSDTVWSGSNVATFLDLFAPGSKISSAYPVSMDPSGVTEMSGTSMAAPHVAGAWAVLRQAEQNLTVDDGLDVLKRTGRKVKKVSPDLRRLDLCAALADRGHLCP